MRLATMEIPMSRDVDRIAAQDPSTWADKDKKQVRRFVSFGKASSFAVYVHKMSRENSYGRMRFTALLRKCAAQWKEFPDKKKKVYDNLSLQHKKRYRDVVRKKNYRVPVIDKDHTYDEYKLQYSRQRPWTPFLFFAVEIRPSVRRGHPNWHSLEIGWEIGRLWRLLSKLKKQKYIQKAMKRGFGKKNGLKFSKKEKTKAGYSSLKENSRGKNYVIPQRAQPTSDKTKKKSTASTQGSSKLSKGHLSGTASLSNRKGKFKQKKVSYKVGRKGKFTATKTKGYHSHIKNMGGKGAKHDLGKAGKSRKALHTKKPRKRGTGNKHRYFKTGHSASSKIGKGAKHDLGKADKSRKSLHTKKPRKSGTGNKHRQFKTGHSASSKMAGSGAKHRDSTAKLGKSNRSSTRAAAAAPRPESISAKRKHGKVRSTGIRAKSQGKHSRNVPYHGTSKLRGQSGPPSLRQKSKQYGSDAEAAHDRGRKFARKKPSSETSSSQASDGKSSSRLKPTKSRRTGESMRRNRSRKLHDSKTRPSHGRRGISGASKAPAKSGHEGRSITDFSHNKGKKSASSKPDKASHKDGSTSGISERKSHESKARPSHDSKSGASMTPLRTVGKARSKPGISKRTRSSKSRSSKKNPAHDSGKNIGTVRNPGIKNGKDGATQDNNRNKGHGSKASSAHGNASKQGASRRRAKDNGKVGSIAKKDRGKSTLGANTERSRGRSTSDASTPEKNKTQVRANSKDGHSAKQKPMQDSGSKSQHKPSDASTPEKNKTQVRANSKDGHSANQRRMQDSGSKSQDKTGDASTPEKNKTQVGSNSKDGYSAKQRPMQDSGSKSQGKPSDSSMPEKNKTHVRANSKDGHSAKQKPMQDSGSKSQGKPGSGSHIGGSTIDPYGKDRTSRQNRTPVFHDPGIEKAEPASNIGMAPRKAVGSAPDIQDKAKQASGQGKAIDNSRGKILEKKSQSSKSDSALSVTTISSSPSAKKSRYAKPTDTNKSKQNDRPPVAIPPVTTRSKSYPYQAPTSPSRVGKSGHASTTGSIDKQVALDKQPSGVGKPMQTSREDNAKAPLQNKGYFSRLFGAEKPESASMPKQGTGAAQPGDSAPNITKVSSSPNAKKSRYTNCTDTSKSKKQNDLPPATIPPATTRSKSYPYQAPTAPSHVGKSGHASPTGPTDKQVTLDKQPSGIGKPMQTTSREDSAKGPQQNKGYFSRLFGAEKPESTSMPKQKTSSASADMIMSTKECPSWCKCTRPVRDFEIHHSESAKRKLPKSTIQVALSEPPFKKSRTFSHINGSDSKLKDSASHDTKEMHDESPAARDDGFFRRLFGLTGAEKAATPEQKASMAVQDIVPSKSCPSFCKTCPIDTHSLKSERTLRSESSLTIRPSMKSHALQTTSPSSQRQTQPRVQESPLKSTQEGKLCTFCTCGYGKKSTETNIHVEQRKETKQSGMQSPMPMCDNTECMARPHPLCVRQDGQMPVCHDSACSTAKASPQHEHTICFAAAQPEAALGEKYSDWCCAQEPRKTSTSTEIIPRASSSMTLSTSSIPVYHSTTAEQLAKPQEQQQTKSVPQINVQANIRSKTSSHASSLGKEIRPSPKQTHTSINSQLHEVNRKSHTNGIDDTKPASGTPSKRQVDCCDILCCKSWHTTQPTTPVVSLQRSRSADSSRHSLKEVTTETIQVLRVQKSITSQSAKPSVRRRSSYPDVGDPSCFMCKESQERLEQRQETRDTLLLPVAPLNIPSETATPNSSVYSRQSNAPRTSAAPSRVKIEYTPHPAPPSTTTSEAEIQSTCCGKLCDDTESTKTESVPVPPPTMPSRTASTVMSQPRPSVTPELSITSQATSVQGDQTHIKSDGNCCDIICCNMCRNGQSTEIVLEDTSAQHLELQQQHVDREQTPEPVAQESRKRSLSRSATPSPRASTMFPTRSSKVMRSDQACCADVDDTRRCPSSCRPCHGGKETAMARRTYACCLVHCSQSARNSRGRSISPGESDDENPSGRKRWCCCT